jgi:hypothetical protein
MGRGEYSNNKKERVKDLKERDLSTLFQQIFIEPGILQVLQIPRKRTLPKQFHGLVGTDV